MRPVGGADYVAVVVVLGVPVMSSLTPWGKVYVDVMNPGEPVPAFRRDFPT